MKTAPAFMLTLTLLGLVACSDGDSASPPRETSAPTSSSAATDGVITPADVPDIPTFDSKARGVISDVTVDSCDTDPGDVAASGSATNSGRSARDVVVVISWTVGDTGDVVARGIATMEDLRPGERADWDVDARVPGSAPASCVTTALAGSVSS